MYFCAVVMPHASYSCSLSVSFDSVDWFEEELVKAFQVAVICMRFAVKYLLSVSVCVSLRVCDLFLYL